VKWLKGCKKADRTIGHWQSVMQYQTRKERQISNTF